MKYVLSCALLLTGLASCEEPAVGALAVSSQANTWVEVRRHWTGAFSGWQHDEYQVLYVRRGFFQDEKQVVGVLPLLDTPILQRVDANTIKVSVASNGSQASLTCTFVGPWPAVQQWSASR